MSMPAAVINPLISSTKLPEQPPRRTRLQGGFVLTPQAALEWAKRLVSADIKLTTMDRTLIWQLIERRIRPKGGRFSMVGEVLGGEYMVVTQRARLDGYKGMDPSLIPEFKEGSREVVARKWLEDEGATILSSHLNRN